ncbi:MULTISPECIES: NUDIX hydrolase [unclassified Streptomyces]|uniref:NUDIX hydrolase n=1 Tax=unclassified Streptomyces TaxID=2593676 RepID=UPI002E19FAE0|nr:MULTISPECIES: NUDIX hydrolase [unclassified Streptomyces]
MSDAPTRDASVVVALDQAHNVAILSADFPAHGGEYVFLPGGRREDDEDAASCARRELKEEAGVTASSFTHLGSYAMTLNSTARIDLFLASGLTLGPQELTDGEQDFKLEWWPLDAALAGAEQGRFLLPAGPLALLLAARLVSETRAPAVDSTTSASR